MDKVYVLMFHDYEASDVVGVFSTMEEAERIKQLLITYPPIDDLEISGYVGSTMGYFSKNRSKKEYASHFQIGTFTLDMMAPEIKLNNLEYLELKAKEKGI
jgi:hypothetical protein